MNQINADSISKVTLAAAVSPPSELTDLATDVAYPATLSRGSEQEPWLLRIGNRAPLPIPPQMIPAPLRQVLTQLMADTSATAAAPATVNASDTTSSSGPTSASPQATAAPAANSPTSGNPATLRAAQIPLQVTVTASQQLQLNPLTALQLTPPQQLQVLQQLAGVSNRRSSWDVKLDSASLASKLPASEFSQSALPPSVTVRLQTPAQQWQLQWQSSPAASFQNVSPSTQQALLAVIGQQVGADAMQWSQLPQDVQQQLEKLNPTLAQTLRQSSMPLTLNLQSQGVVLQPAAPQAVPLSSSQWSQLMPNPPPAMQQQGSVTISEAARAAMAQEQATLQRQSVTSQTANAAKGLTNPFNATTEAATIGADVKLPTSPTNLSNTRATTPPSNTAINTMSAKSETAANERSEPAGLGNKQQASPATIQRTSIEQRPPVDQTALRDSGSASTNSAQLRTPHDSQLQRKTLHEHATAGSITAAKQPVTLKQPLTEMSATSQSAESAVTFDTQEALPKLSPQSSRLTTTPQQGTAAARPLLTNPRLATQLPDRGAASLDNSSTESATNESPHQVTAATPTRVVSAALQATGPTLAAAQPNTSPQLPSKQELTSHLLQLLTLLSSSGSVTGSGAASHSSNPHTEAQLQFQADTLALTDAPAAQRPLLQQLQHAMIEPQVLSEAQLQQQLNAALLFNPLQPSMATTAAGTLAVAMQLLLGRLGVPVPDTHKSDKTQKLKEAVQLLELGQARETLKQLASHAGAYQTAQLETLAQQKPEQNNWYFQLPLPMQGQSQFAELTVEQRQARKVNGQMAPLWHLTLALEVPPHGRLVMEGALGPDANSLQFYTASPELKRSIEKFGVILRDRLKLQGVPIAQFQCTLGELPAHLAQKQSSLLQVQV